MATAAQRASKKNIQQEASASLQEKELTAPPASPNRSAAGSPVTGHQLQVILAEYNALRAEIQFLSDFQNRLLQLHATALTVIIGAAFSLAAGPWIIFLIPIEASIFGLWFNDHAIVIDDIGNYIQNTIEGGVAELLPEPHAMNWEKSQAVLDAPIQKFTFPRMLSITFAGPSLVALFITLIFILLSISAVRNILPGFLSLQIPVAYPGIRCVLAGFIWIICGLLWIMYSNYDRYRKHHTNRRRTKSKRQAEEH